MVNCCVPECTNHSSKTSDVSYHQIPTAPSLKKAWIARIRRANLPPSKNYVCSKHFQPDCFERDLKAELTGQKSKRKLKPNSIPSVFDFSSTALPAKRRATSENRAKRQRHTETLDEVLEAPSTNTSGSLEITSETQASTPTHKDIGIQCNLSEISITVTKTISTQTHVDNTEASTQADVDIQAFVQLQNVSPQKSILSLESVSSIDEFDESGNDDDDDYTITSSQGTESSNDSDYVEDVDHAKFVSEPKIVVFESCLKKLFMFCSSCGAIVTEVKISYTGCLTTVNTDCIEGHSVTWYSQPLIDKTPVGTLLICSSILFSGNTFQQIQDLAACLNLQFFSKQVFYRNQDKYLFPVINEAWNNERNTVVQALARQDTVNLTGDGRCDSPGHNAKYGTYTLMDSGYLNNSFA